MAYPQPGDVGVQGVVAWISFVPGLNLWVGAVDAFASIYGTPPAYGPNFNLFQFQSPTEITGQVRFDIVQGNDAAYATNVAPA